MLKSSNFKNCGASVIYSHQIFFVKLDPHKFHGKDIPHIKLDPKMTIEDLVNVFASSGYNGRQLGEAAKLYAK